MFKMHKEFSSTFQLIAVPHIKDAIACDNVKWHFIFLFAPHFDGLWKNGRCKRVKILFEKSGWIPHIICRRLNLLRYSMFFEFIIFVVVSNRMLFFY